jgi:CIC family chloride channel protein
MRARNSELVLLVVAALVGGGAGLVVSVLDDLLRLFQAAAFGLGTGEHLSGNRSLDPMRALVVLGLGGLAVGLALRWVRRLRPRDVVDPVEANALYGGRMSLVDSLRLAAATFLSAGCGASVGMEAAYGQLGSCLGSKTGQFLRLRRKDLRLLVGCGAGASLAAAFNAPFAGAFYAFELVIGSYAPAVLAPVMVAVLAGTFAARGTLGATPLFSASGDVHLAVSDFGLFAVLGLAAALVGVLTMRLVPAIERRSKRVLPADWMRPAAGGLLVGLIAWEFPEVLGSGQGAIQDILDTGLDTGLDAGHGAGLPLALLAGMLAAKAAASAISVGMGFRGGLFSSSLLLGALLGTAFVAVVQALAPGLGIDRVSYTLVGMGAVGAAIVGAPVTMILLVLELTADFPVTAGTMIAVVIASSVVNQAFGYSFSTWRFHLRGVPIRSAHDVGWLRDLSVGRLMREDPQTAECDTPVGELRRRFPLGSTKQVFLVDRSGHYAGILALARIHDPDLDQKDGSVRAQDLCQDASSFLTPDQNVRAALGLFAASETEALPVLAGPKDRRILGYLTEAYALRRYSDELERARSMELGDSPLFGPS